MLDSLINTVMDEYDVSLFFEREIEADGEKNKKTCG